MISTYGLNDYDYGLTIIIWYCKNKKKTYHNKEQILMKIKNQKIFDQLFVQKKNRSNENNNAKNIKSVTLTSKQKTNIISSITRK